MTDKKILAIIPARGGSKGLPRKNIIELAEKPLIAWSIESALNSKYITTTVVSSEDDEILTVAEDWGAKIIRRPDALAEDSTASEPVIVHALHELQQCYDENYDYVVLLQPTSPLRTAQHLDGAFEKLFSSSADALISVSHYDNKVLKTFLKNEEGYLHGISNNCYPFMRRQDLPDVYMPNGAIYIIDIKVFLQNEKLFTSKTLSYQMSEVDSLDIDNFDDLKKAEHAINHKTVNY